MMTMIMMIDNNGEEDSSSRIGDDGTLAMNLLTMAIQLLRSIVGSSSPHILDDARLGSCKTIDDDNDDDDDDDDDGDDEPNWSDLPDFLIASLIFLGILIPGGHDDDDDDDDDDGIDDDVDNLALTVLEARHTLSYHGNLFSSSDSISSSSSISSNSNTSGSRSSGSSTSSELMKDVSSKVIPGRYAHVVYLRCIIS